MGGTRLASAVDRTGTPLDQGPKGGIASVAGQAPPFLTRAMAIVAAKHRWHGEYAHLGASGGYPGIRQFWASRAG